MHPSMCVVARDQLAARKPCRSRRRHLLIVFSFAICREETTDEEKKFEAMALYHIIADSKNLRIYVCIEGDVCERYLRKDGFLGREEGLYRGGCL